MTYAQGSICPPWPTHPITFHGCPISLHGGYSTQSKTGYYPNRTRGCGGGSRDGTGHPGTYITPMQDPPPTLNRFLLVLLSPQFPPREVDPQRTHSPEHPHRRGGIPGGGKNKTVTERPTEKCSFWNKTTAPMAAHTLPPSPPPGGIISPLLIICRDLEGRSELIICSGGSPLNCGVPRLTAS